MKKFFLTMLVGLLPLVGWAQEATGEQDQQQAPEPYLLFDETTYAGDATDQPIVVDGWIYRVLNEKGEEVEWIRDAGVYTVVVWPGDQPRLQRAGDTAIEGDGEEGDGETVGGEGTEAPYEFTYTVKRAELFVRPNNTPQYYGDPRPKPNWGFASGYWQEGDKASNFTVEGLWYDRIQSTLNLSVKNYTFGLLIDEAVLLERVISEDGRTFEWVENTNYELKTDNTALLIVSPADVYVSIDCENNTKEYGHKDPQLAFNFVGFPVDEDGNVTEDETSIIVYNADGKEIGTTALDLSKIVVTREEGENVRDAAYLYTIATEQKELPNGRKYTGVKGIDAPNFRFLLDQSQCGLIITPRDIHSEGITVVVDPDAKEYDGNEWDPTFTITDNFSDLGDDYVGNLKTGLEENVDYLAQAKGLHAGDKLEYWIDGIGNYYNGLNDAGEANPMTGDGGCDEGTTCGRHGGGGDDDFDEEVTPKCLNIVPVVEEDAVVGEGLEVSYTITGWAAETDDEETLTDVLVAVLDFAVDPAEANAGEEVTVSVVVPDALPDELSDYTICQTGTTTTTFQPICIAGEIIAEISEIADQYYTGSAIEPAFTVTFDGEELEAGTDYTYEFTDNVEVGEAELTVTGTGNYECSVSARFSILPLNGIIRVANVDLNEPMVNAKSYGQSNESEILTLEFIGMDEEGKEIEDSKVTFIYKPKVTEADDPTINDQALAILPEGVYPWRMQGENVGEYDVFFKNADGEILTGTEVDPAPYEYPEAVDNRMLTLIPGKYDIIKNSLPLSFHYEFTETYGEIGIDATRLTAAKRQAYLEELIEEYFDKFTPTNLHANDEGKLRLSGDINTNIVNPWGITFDDIAINGVSITKGGVPNLELYGAVICPNTGYLHAGTYHVDIVGATSPNYNIGEITMDVTITQRPIKITFDDVELAPREEIDLSTVTWTAEVNNAAKKRGYAVLDAPLDADNSILNVVPIIGKVTGKLTLDLDEFNPDYKPEIKKGEVTETPGHFILHRVAADLQDNEWNDAVKKITAFDGQTVEKVYFRTFNLAGTDNLFDDLFNDGELEPVTAEVDGELDTENGFPMYAKKWYAMVLPFDVTVYELGREFFEYGVINVLDRDNEDETVIAFKLQSTGTIKANTPFCVQLGDMGRVNEELPFVVKNLDQMYFENKKIVKPENFDEIEVHDKSGVKFYASYTGKLGFAENERYYTTSANPKYDDGFLRGGVNPNTGNENTTWMRPTGAFLSLPADQARTIIMQEEDGTYTQIKAIENINSVKSTEGWFTTNGMKLNAQPTEKGIYIHNGKKVVVK